jgi:hypothetical protein
MPILYGCTVMVLSGSYMVLQEGRKSWLPNLGVVAPYYLGKHRKESKERTLFVHNVERRRRIGEPQENLLQVPSRLS